MVRQDFYQVAPRENDHWVTIVAQLPVRLFGNVGRRDQHSELPRANTGDEARLCFDSHRRRHREALGFEREVQLNRILGRPERVEADGVAPAVAARSRQVVPADPWGPHLPEPGAHPSKLTGSARKCS